VLRVKQLAGSMAAVTVIGIVATAAGLSVFSTSGQTGSDEIRATSDRPRPLRKASETPAPETIVKTYYIGDLIIPRSPAGPPGSADWPEGGPGAKIWADMDLVIDLITSTVARGTWTVDRIQTGASSSDGKHGMLSSTPAPSRTVGAIKPFFLSISLIVRHTAEVHDEVANLLRHLRRLLDSLTPPAGDRKPVPSAPASPSDRNARIRRLLDELRKEVEALPADRG
jgi:hypothetical protein